MDNTTSDCVCHDFVSRPRKRSSHKRTHLIDKRCRFALTKSDPPMRLDLRRHPRERPYDGSRVLTISIMSNSKSKRPPDLHDAVKVLENISRDTHLKTPKAVGEIYLASLALLYHLRLDQATIRTIK